MVGGVIYSVNSVLNFFIVYLYELLLFIFVGFSKYYNIGIKKLLRDATDLVPDAENSDQSPVFFVVATTIKLCQMTLSYRFSHPAFIPS